MQVSMRLENRAETGATNYGEGIQLIDQLQDWLEREDSLVDKAVGYGACFLVVLYLTGHCIKSLLG